ncbi:MAG TPA: hypothetical protein VNH11_25230 [Pirellulales bacterium]|nr:hypothetical protein [Pirellulales bacterium]
MAENLLTVAALRGTMEAEMIRSKLEAAGISAVLLEPEKGPDGAPTTRVQVQVSPPDFERAMQLLFPIPQLKRPGKEQKPPWKCPKCGEQVLAQFPVCWKCGTGREGQPTAAIAQPLPAVGPVPDTAPPSVAPAVASPRPAPPPAPAAQLPPAQTISRMATAAEAPLPEIKIPPIPMQPPAAPPPARASMNGESAVKPVALAPLRARTAEDEALKIVVPPWDPAAGRKKVAAGEANEDNAKRTEADDRAARRAWYTAVFGIVCPPLLLYSMWVVLVLGLTNRPLSGRGHRFFYGALLVNAVLIAAFFAWFGRQQ